ncbi:hypothetical protein ACYHQC_000204 [Aeromonas salmonicida]
MDFHWQSLLLGASPLLIGLCLNFLLDAHLWPPIIKLFNFIPVRSIFRDNPPNLRGEWDVYWASNSQAFINEKDRHKTATIYQFNNFIYADYPSKDQRYCLIGKIKGQYITGTWFNKNDRFGYHGAFQLKITDSKSLNGRWLGFSISTVDINTDTYEWSKNPI